MDGQFLCEAWVKQLIKEAPMMRHHRNNLDVIGVHKFLNHTRNGLILCINDMKAQRFVVGCLFEAFSKRIGLLWRERIALGQDMEDLDL